MWSIQLGPLSEPRVQAFLAMRMYGHKTLKCFVLTHAHRGKPRLPPSCARMLERSPTVDSRYRDSKSLLNSEHNLKCPYIHCCSETLFIVNQVPGIHYNESRLLA